MIFPQNAKSRCQNMRASRLTQGLTVCKNKLLIVILGGVLTACGTGEESLGTGQSALINGQVVLNTKDGEVPVYLAGNDGGNVLSNDQITPAFNAAEAQLDNLVPKIADQGSREGANAPIKADASTSHLRAVADFDGDGNADVLWQTGAGETTVSLMASTGVLGCYGLGTFTTQVMGTGDFNGDGNADIVWRNMSTGAVSITLMNGGTITQTLSVGQSPIALNTKLEGIGDFDGNGRADMLWRNQSTGRSVMSYHNTDGSVASWPEVSKFINPTSTTAMKVGDINGDGKDDIVWRNMNTGNVVISLMDGNSALWRGITTSPIPLSVRLEAIGDFDNNGKADLLWRNSETGRSLMSFHNADGSVSSWPVVSNFINPANTSAVGAGDFDGDGKTDILWRNLNTGNSVISIMNSSLPNWQAVSFTDCQSSGLKLLAGAFSVGHVDAQTTTARFNSPRGLAIDRSGNMYVSDAGSHTIRKINISGFVSTIAGTLNKAGGDDGQGTAGLFSIPGDIVLDTQGNLYVADMNVIRKITPNGTVTSLAGQMYANGGVDGAGSTARFGYMLGLGIDSSDNILVADFFNHQIRRVTPSGIVTTLAGRAEAGTAVDGPVASASFSRPTDVVQDTAGNIYVVDGGLNYGTGKGGSATIRKISSAGFVSTIAGANGQFGTVDGIGSTARFQDPTSIILDVTGNLIVSEHFGATVRKVNAAGGVTTIAGVGSQDPMHPVINSKGGNDGQGTSATFNGPSGMAIDASGNLFVVDTGNHNIRKISPTSALTTYAGPQPDYGYINGTGGTARFLSARSIVSDPSGNTYVADSGNHVIRKVTSSGVVTTLAGTGQCGYRDGPDTTAQFCNPIGITLDLQGNLYVGASGVVRKITPTGQVSSLAGRYNIYGDTDGQGPDAILGSTNALVSDPNGNIYVGSWGKIKKITPAGVVSTFAGNPTLATQADGQGTSAGFGQITALTMDSFGNIYLGDNQALRKVSPTGMVTTIAGQLNQIPSAIADGQGATAKFSEIRALTIDSLGNLYASDKSLIRKINGSALVTTILGANHTETSNYSFNDFDYIEIGTLPAKVGNSSGLSIAKGKLIIASHNALLNVRINELQ
jgi:hypothetical protein